MALHQDLFSDATTAQNAARCGEAALLFRRAAAAALEVGDRAAWFRMLYWAAYSTNIAGDPRSALSLLVDALAGEPEDAPVLEAWLARVQSFDIQLDTRPERRRLEEGLQGLHAYAQGRGVPQADAMIWEGLFLDARGDWAAALARYEAGWQAHDGRGYGKPFFADEAAKTSLRLGCLPACRDWIEAQGRAAKADRANQKILHTQRRLDLALAEGAPQPDLTALLRRLTDQTLPTQLPRRAAELREYTVRVRLRDPALGDPADPLHPARGELRRRQPHRHHVHLRWEARLLFLDYRLACLRHAAGLPPLDDRFYRQPDDLTRVRRADKRSASAIAPDLAARLHKARTAADWAMAYARKLDGWLQCDWREQEVAGRRGRIEVIAAGLGLGK